MSKMIYWGRLGILSQMSLSPNKFILFMIWGLIEKKRKYFKVWVSKLNLRLNVLI
jgi:hypothetical protein